MTQRRPSRLQGTADPQQTDARIVQGWFILRLVQEAIHARSMFHELIEESVAQCHPAPNVKCKGTVHY